MLGNHLARAAIVAAAASCFASAAMGATVVIQPGPEGKDINIADGQLANSNLSYASPWLISAWSPGPTGRVRSIGLVQFDLSSLAGYTIQSASLQLYQTDNFDPNATYSVFRITSDWSEGAVTFNTAPSIDPTAVATLTFPASDINGGPGGIPVRSAFRTWDVTTAVQGWVAGTYDNFGLWVERTAQDPNDDRPTVYLAASDWPTEPNGFPPGVYGTQYLPALIVEATPVPVPATLPLLAAGLGVLGLFGNRRRAS